MQFVKHSLVLSVFIGASLAFGDEVTTRPVDSPKTKCDVMEEFNCDRACRGVQRTLCAKQANGSYLCICFNGDIYSTHHTSDGKLAFFDNAFGRTTKAPYPYYLEPLHLGKQGPGVTDPCDPRSKFRHIFNYDERIAQQKSNDVSDKVFI
ncbi:uncharacterized protein LOC114828573 [Galendromus occidentalis]|uniref:Uncharacterized protein LOC114828573 n=1 Tax=Galendromus occidentalis TaxID=34638 RepID=A0AAJ7SIB6_9ACAR|nr:uncharacterized protein LOC114828573 [Galendromus occidentalis]